MKKIFPILAAAIIGGFSGNFIQNKFLPKEIAPLTISNSAEFKPANFNYLSTNESLSDFSIAAEKTIHSVVHVKNLKEGNLVNNKAFEYFFGYQYKYVLCFPYITKTKVNNACFLNFRGDYSFQGFYPPSQIFIQKPRIFFFRFNMFSVCFLFNSALALNLCR